MSDEIKVEHIDMMAADLHDRAAKLYREGRPDHAHIVGEIAAALHNERRPDSEYIRALGFAGAGTGSTVRLRDYFEAIQRGEWLAGSFVGRLLKMRADAESARAAESWAIRLPNHEGRRDAFDTVLALLGVQP